MLSCAQPALHCKRITSLRAISREAGARVSGDISVAAGVGDIACPSVLPWHPPARAASCPPSHTQSREPAAELCPIPSTLHFIHFYKLLFFLTFCLQLYIKG